MGQRSTSRSAQTTRSLGRSRREYRIGAALGDSEDCLESSCRFVVSLAPSQPFSSCAWAPCGRESGGGGRNRTRADGFAGRCLTIFIKRVRQSGARSDTLGNRHDFDARELRADSSIDLSSVAHADHEHQQQVILKITDNPIVADAVLPKATRNRSFQRRSELSRVVTMLDALSEKTQDPVSPRRVELRQVLLRTFDELNAPRHGASASRPASRSLQDRMRACVARPDKSPRGR